ncbi:MAG: type II secretion system F family protein [Phycisphaerales bacterium]|nr:type II secretion system F family protein [Phycisphaerae bacterium]NNF42113.1 type II secretion system F family protein [Phycisphaerales bacterium]NNM26440.1 type II secretion system F family protein [Phycisphaerales bacterium]
MATFAYIARNDDGERVTGQVSGGTRQAALAELSARQLAPVRVEEVRERTRWQRGVSARQLATAYRQLSDLLRAGVPLLRGLRLLGRGRANPRLAGVLEKIADEVAEGGPLADGLAAHPEIFPAIHVAMIRAGERGGFLEPVLARMGRFIEHQADMRGRVVGNLIYPVVLLLVGVGVVVFALVFLVPKFANFYARIELPLPTKVLLASSDILLGYWPLLLALLALLAGAGWWLVQQPRVRRLLARGQLRVPKLGELSRDLAVGRFARILGTLLENGIPMLPAMQISRDATGHILLVEAIDEATDAVRAGETLAEPLAASGMMAEDTIEMIRVGESANNLPEVLITMADTIEKRVDRLLGAFVRLMEPLLLLLMAGMVVCIFVALVVPMLRMSASIG